MKRLSIFVVLASLIASCNSTGNEPENAVEYPIVTGTWKVNSPNDANWIGDQNKQKIATLQADSTSSDSVLIDRPNGQTLKIWNKYRSNAFHPTWLAFTDSATSIPETESTNDNEGYYIGIDFSDKQYIQLDGYYLGDPIESSDMLTFEISIKSNCSMIKYGTTEPGNLPPPEDESMNIHLISKFADTGIDTVKTYVIDIAGIKGVVDHLYCSSYNEP